MATWREFERASPALAKFGFERLNCEICYLATVTKNCSPRVYPVAPMIGGGHLFVFMEPTSPKGHDILAGSRYAMHSLVTTSIPVEGEFSLKGWGRLIEDAGLRAIATEAWSESPEPQYVLFELFVESAMSIVYDDAGPVRTHWAGQ